MVGSTFKLILYYAALENGFTATTMLKQPTSFIIEDDVYEPQNYSGYAYELYHARPGDGAFDNIYAVKTHLFLSPSRHQNGKEVQHHRRFAKCRFLAGWLNPAHRDVKRMRSSPTAQDVHYYVEKIETEDGKILYEKTRKNKQIFDEKIVFVGAFDDGHVRLAPVTGTWK